MTTEGQAPSPKVPIWRRRRVVTLALLLILATMVIVVLIQPATPEPEPMATDTNTVLFEAMVANGVPDALVDVTDERALLRYNVPEDMDRDEAMWRAVGAAAAVVDGPPTLVLQVFEDYEPVEEIVVPMEDVRALTGGEISTEEFEERVERREL